MKTILQDLSTELLVKIFEYCSLIDLIQLQKTCKQFCVIINTTNSIGNNIPLLVTNLLHLEYRNRSSRYLTIKQKCSFTYNWQNGTYNERYVLKTKKKLMPSLVLTREHLWITRGNQILKYYRIKNNFKAKDLIFSIGSSVNADVCKFSHKYNHIVAGYRNGDLLIWKTQHDNVLLSNRHESDVDTVDIGNDLVVSGSKDNTIKLWKLNTDIHEPLHSHNFNDHVRSSAFYQQTLAVGTAGFNSIPPIHIYDLSSYSVKQTFGNDFPKGAGSLQLKWEDRNILLSSGYDKNVRKWDLRTGSCVRSWEDPFYATVYCFDTDNCCTLLTGTESNGRVILWDMRATQYVQIYFMETCKRSVYSSPIYSLSFDATHLYAASDRFLNILDFSVKKAERKDYRNLFATTLCVFK